MRLPDWPGRFVDLMVRAASQPFEWGVHDCCLWAADAVHALTGVDPAWQWRGTYRTEAEASRLVERLGGLPLIGAKAGPAIAQEFATTGDIGLVRWPDGVVCLGVCAAPGWLVVGDAGLVRLEGRALLAWGVGRE